MKRISFIIVFLGIVFLSSCRSTSKPCGLAHNESSNHTIIKSVVT